MAFQIRDSASAHVFSFSYCTRELGRLTEARLMFVFAQVLWPQTSVPIDPIMKLEAVSKSWLPTALAVAGGTAAMIFLTNRGKKKDSEEQAPAKPRVYGFLPIDGHDADASPACLKLETFLKMTSTDFDLLFFPQHEMKGSPKGKMPWIHWDAIHDGRPLSDSTLIINELVRKDPSKYDLDSHLTKEEKAIATAFKTMLEESVYFQMFYARWKSPEFERVSEPLYFATFPFFVRWLVGKQVCGKMLRDLSGQGTGLLTESEVLEKFLLELDATAIYLGDKKYFMGDKLTSYDATVFAYLASLMTGDWEHPIFNAAREKHPNLVNYVNRMRVEFWPEYASSSH